MDAPAIKGYYAYGTGNTRTAIYPFPTTAPEQYFRQFPGKRKCTVQEVEKDPHGGWITRHCAPGRGVSSRTWKDVTPKNITHTFYSVLLEIEVNKGNLT